MVIGHSYFPIEQNATSLHPICTASSNLVGYMRHFSSDRPLLIDSGGLGSMLMQPVFYLQTGWI